MKPIPVRALYKLDFEDLIRLKTDLPIQFENGSVIKVFHKELIVSILLTRFLPEWNIKILPDILISNYYTNGYFSSSSYTKLYSVLYYRIIKEYLEPNNLYNEYEFILKDMYKTINFFQNEFVSRIQDYNIGIEISDVLPIALDEEIILSIKKVNEEPTQANIEKSYKVLDKIIKEGKYKDNIMTLVYQSGMVNINQLRQLFGSRGFLTEINSKIFKQPMVNSFTLGFKNMYEALIESRAGAKALYMSTNAIRKSEQVAREFQLATMPVEEIVYTDCGNRDYIEFYVRPKEVDENGKVIWNGDLQNLIGSKYMNEKGEWETITPDHKFLEGKTIKLRSILHCKLRNKKQICSACYGDLVYGLFKHSNLGHINVTNITRDISQSLLSTKHLLKSASASEITLDSVASQFFVIKNTDKLYIKPNLVGKKNTRVILHIPQTQVLGLRGLETLNLLNINISKLSRIKGFTLEIRKGDKSEFYPIKIKNGNRGGFFTLEFLFYIKKKGFSIDENDDYAIDITDIDPKKTAIIKYERAEFDFNALSSEFASLIAKRRYVLQNGRRTSEFTAEVLVQKIFDLLNKKLNINIKKIETLVYGFTVFDLDKDNYDLGRNSKYLDVVGLKYAIDYRSIGGSFGWSRLLQKIFNPYLMVEDNKPDHPMDVLFKPNEVVNYYNKVYENIKNGK